MKDRRAEMAMPHAYEMFKELWLDRFDWVDDPHRTDTPLRFVKMLKDLTTRQEFNFTTFESDSDEMIVLRDINFNSLCAHHIVPFIGKAHIAYVPNGKIAGLSKFARVVKYFAADLTVQENLTRDIASYLETQLRPKGVAVVLEAEHMCMALRGVQAPGVTTTTSDMRGVFADHTRLARGEFLSLIRGGK